MIDPQKTELSLTCFKWKCFEQCCCYVVFYILRLLIRKSIAMST